MKFKKKMALMFAAIGFSVLSHAQTGIGTFNPDKSARLDIYSDKTGFLMPRVALIRTTQQNPITAPATSLMVYNTATSNDVTPGYYYWDGQKWTRIAKSDEYTFTNGLTATNGNVQLGGTLTQPSTLTTTATSTLSIKGLQTGAAADNILVADANGILKTVTRASLGDNLGNHIATQDLNMSSKSILNIFNAYIKNEAQIFDRVTSNTTYFGLYKNNGYFGIWNNLKNTNALVIDENTNKTTLVSAQITHGTDGGAAVPGYIATAADVNGNIVWTNKKDIYVSERMTSSAIAPGASATITFSSNPDFASIIVSTSNNCTRNAIAVFNSSKNVICFLGGQARNSTYTSSVVDADGAILKLTNSGVIGCADGGDGSQFDFTINKNENTLTITNNGNVSKTYSIRFSEL